MIAIPDSRQHNMLHSNHMGRGKAFYTFTGLAVFIFCITLVSLARHPPSSAAKLFPNHLDLEPVFSFEKVPIDDSIPPEQFSHHSIVSDHPPKSKPAAPEPDLHVPLVAPAQIREKNAAPEAIRFEGVKSKYAFATFLVGSDNQELAYEDNHYFLATRILTYQLLHHNTTRLRDRNIPFIVVVTERVPERNREILRKDGATVILVPSLSMDWLAPSISEWEHVMTKLRLWEFVDFERIAFIDADTILTGVPLDDIFNDAAVAEQQTQSKEDQVTEGAPPMPSTYVFAGNAEFEHEHEFPPTPFNGAWANMNYLNAGFFVMKPDLELLKYYIHFLNTPDSFDSQLPEQNLLNHVHRREGNMPWAQLDSTFNVHYPSMSDIEKGAKSIHEKWWWPQPGPLRTYMEAWRWRMEGYYEARDQAAKSGVEV